MGFSTYLSFKAAPCSLINKTNQMPKHQRGHLLHYITLKAFQIAIFLTF